MYNLTINDSFADLCQQQLNRTLVIKMIYDKVISVFSYSQDESLKTLVFDLLNNYPLSEIEASYRAWASYPKFFKWHNRPVTYELSVILALILPYYIDYTKHISKEFDSYRPTPANDHFRIIKPLGDEAMPPAYAVKHINNMLDILQKSIIEKAKNQSKGGAKNAFKTEKTRRLFSLEYCNIQATNPAWKKSQITDKALDNLSLKGFEINDDIARKWVTKLNKFENIHQSGLFQNYNTQSQIRDYLDSLPPITQN